VGLADFMSDEGRTGGKTTSSQATRKKKQKTPGEPMQPEKDQKKKEKRKLLWLQLQKRLHLDGFHHSRQYLQKKKKKGRLAQTRK